VIAAENFGETRLAFCFQAIVELLPEARLHLLQDATRIDALGHEATDQRLQHADVFEITLDRIGYARVLHLHGHDAAVDQTGAVHLAD
jgi:hypothetical protein